QACELRGGSYLCTSVGSEAIDARGNTADVSASLDADGDGVPDGSDNCPTVANAKQENEDGDAFGDACDLCPPFASNNADADGDGVGDECDPHPQTPGDAIALWEGFADGMPPTWTASTEWSVSGGNLITTANANNSNTLVVPFTDSPHQTIYTHATITAQTSTTGGSLGIVD